MIDLSHARYHHVCEEPPQILRVTGSMSLDGPMSPLRLWMDYPVGTRHICDVCRRVLVVRWIESPYVNVMGSYQWVPETRRERRRRLGLKWWQRERPMGGCGDPECTDCAQEWGRPILGDEAGADPNRT